VGVVRAARVLQIKVVARNSSCGTLKPRETMTYSSRAGNHCISCCGAAFLSTRISRYGNSLRIILLTESLQAVGTESQRPFTPVALVAIQKWNHTVSSPDI
jgi:hypothetical protein